MRKFALLSFAAVILGVATTAKAANTIVFAGVGSSAMFNQFKQAAQTKLGVDPTTNSYQANSAGIAVDPTGAPNSTGAMWVVWDAAAANNHKIYLYLSLDSTVGVRCFFNKATLSLPGTQPAPAKDAFGNQTVAMDADVKASLAGFRFNAGMTDITPADAKVATSRTFSLGYSSANPVRGLSATANNASTVIPVNFSLGNRPYELKSIGASPVMVFVNKLLTTGDDLGTAECDNVNRYTLAGFLDGTFSRTSDLISSALVSKPVVTFFREPLSGTYVTTEYCIPQSVYTSQEYGILSSGSGNNPANKTVPQYDRTNPTAALTSGGRVRAIGGGALLAAVNATPNALGYSFWSNANFATATSGNTRYLTVDGCDPLLDAYAGGTYPSPTQITFRNVINGGYPAWSLLRMVVEPGTIVGEFSALVDQAIGANSGGDIVPLVDLRVFRSHRSTQDVPVANNGVLPSSVEAGSDAGGAVFYKKSETNYNADTGFTLTGLWLGNQPRRR